MPEPRRLIGFTAAVLLCPIWAYFVFWVVRSFEQLLSGHGFHPFRPFVGIGIISLFSGGHHQWSAVTILVYYIICLAVALPLLALSRFWSAQRRAALRVIWALACGIYFFLFDRPYAFGWQWGGYGALAGATAGVVHYYLAYVPTSRNA